MAALRRKIGYTFLLLGYFKKSNMKIILPIVLLISLVAPAKASVSCGVLAEYYLEYAKAENDSTKDGLGARYFFGYVSGFLAGDNNRWFDIPPEVNDGKLAHLVGKWLQAHPEKWHLPKNQCVYNALRETSPYN